MQFFQLAFFGTGDVKLKVVVVCLQSRKDNQEPD